LTDHVLIELVLDFTRCGGSGRIGTARPAASFFLIDDGLTQIDAFAAYIDVSWTFDERPDVAMALAAKRAVSVAVPPCVSGWPAPVHVSGCHVPSSEAQSIRCGKNQFQTPAAMAVEAPAVTR